MTKAIARGGFPQQSHELETFATVSASADMSPCRTVPLRQVASSAM